MASLNPRTGTLGFRLAKHLLRRTTFKVDINRIDEFSSLTAQQAVAALLQTQTPSMAEPVDWRNDHQPWINSGPDPVSAEFYLRNFVKSWWLNEARLDETIGHKMMFFLHANFVTHTESLTSYFNFDHYELLRYYALGSFRDLAVKMSIDQLMLDYLDGRWSTKYNPNENYAREFLELFTIGKGPQIASGDYTNYTELDVQEAARIFTGWRVDGERNTIDPNTNIPQGFNNVGLHDVDDKTFSYHFQNQTITGRNTAAGALEEIEDFVDLVFAQDATAQFIVRKLYRYFVGWDITQEIEDDIIVPLAVTFKNNYNFTEVLTELLTSVHFYDEDDASTNDNTIGALIKSPLENVLQTMNFFDINVPSPTNDGENHYEEFYRKGMMYDMFEIAGMNIFEPTTVAGYEAYYQEPNYHRNWFNSSTIISRYKIPEMFLTGDRVLSYGTLGGVQLNIVDWVNDNVTDAFDADNIVNTFVSYLFSEDVGPERMAYYRDSVFLDGLAPAEWTAEWNNYLASGDQGNVTIPLSNLFTGILYSQEYQLS